MKGYHQYNIARRVTTDKGGIPHSLGDTPKALIGTTQKDRASKKYQVFDEVT